MNHKMKLGLGGLLAALLAWFGLGSASATPKAPTALTARVTMAAAGPDSLIVTWDPAPTSGSAVDGYRVSITVNGQIATAAVTTSVGVRRVAWAIAGVLPGQTATLAAAVEAHNAKGYGPAGTAQTSYTAADLVPGAPTVQLQVKP